MMKDEKLYNTKPDMGFMVWILFFLLSKILTDVLPAWEVISKPIAGFLFWVVWAVFALIVYWIPPRPRISYLRWIVIFGLSLVGWYLSVSSIPKFLGRMLPAVVALGLPVFLFFLIFYWVIQLLRPSEKYNFAKWALWSGTIAIIFSVFNVFLAGKGLKGQICSLQGRI